MYSVVLATMLATSGTAPAGGFGFGAFHGCGYSSCSGCCGYVSYYSGCCGGCYGGCCGYPAYSACCGSFSYYGSCYGCSGCCGYSNYYGGCYGCSGCTGCFGSPSWYVPSVYAYSPYNPYLGGFGYGSFGGSCCGTVSAYSMGMSYAAAPVPVGLTRGTLVVKAPLDVKVTVNGQLASRTTEEQTFSTPALEPNQNYFYQVTAETVVDGKTVTRTEKVAINANKSSRVDFSDLSSAAVARVTILAPKGAKILVDNFPVQVDAEHPSFETPKLPPGNKFFYVIKAEMLKEGKTLIESKRVIVSAGEKVTVDFADLVPSSMVSR